MTTPRDTSNARLAARSSVRKTILGESSPIRPCPPPWRAKDARTGIEGDPHLGGKIVDAFGIREAQSQCVAVEADERSSCRQRRE